MRLPRLKLKGGRRLWLGILIVALLVAAAIAAAIIVTRKPDIPKTGRDACKMLNIADAEVVLGDKVQKLQAESVSQLNENDDEVWTSKCSYRQVGSGNDTLSAEITIKQALTKAKADQLRKDFKNTTKNQQKVGTYGEKSTWDFKNGQYNVLKDRTWYTVRLGSPNATDRSPLQTDQLASLFSGKY